MAQKSKAVGYVRVSKDEELKGSIDQQKASIKKYCDKKQYALTEIYEDRGISGKNIEARPDFQRLIADAEGRVFDVLTVMVWHSYGIGPYALSIANLHFLAPGLSGNSVVRFNPGHITIRQASGLGCLGIHF